MILFSAFPKGVTNSSCPLSPPLRFGRFERQVFQVVDLCIMGLPMLL